MVEDIKSVLAEPQPNALSGSLAASMQQSMEKWTEDAIMALGQSVLSWSFLETSLDLLLEVLVGRHGMAKIKTMKLISTNVDMRDKLKLIVALTFETGTSKEVTKEVVSVVNLVDQELRSERNRLVHDVWKHGSGGLMRTKRQGSKVRKPQAHKMELEMPSPEPIGSSEINKFNQKCSDASLRAIGVATTLLDSWQKSLD